MSALDYLLTAPDPFTLFGLERRYEVDPVLLEQRYNKLTGKVKSLSARDPVKAVQVLDKLGDGRRVLLNPVARGDHLLDLLGGAHDAITDGLPPGFLDKLDMLRRIKSEHEVGKERERMMMIVG